MRIIEVEVEITELAPDGLFDKITVKNTQGASR